MLNFMNYFINLYFVMINYFECACEATAVGRPTVDELAVQESEVVAAEP